MTSVAYIFMYISPPRGCIIIWYRIHVKNATRSRVAANDDGLMRLQIWYKVFVLVTSRVIDSLCPRQIDLVDLKQDFIAYIKL